ncbi:arylsulfatase [bacterium]|nr:arylsulfatase [bacterium]MDB4669772.1 arylsulfatase [bacterium]MDB4734635.1 arylsulfatase [Akkermansiaceae bacterium]
MRLILPLFFAAAAALLPAASKPNILFILTDDQGYGDLASHGHPLLKTPNLDKLAAESVRFDNFYVSPSCSPTRAALLTGMHEFRSGVTHTIQPREHLSQSATILPQLLATAGYRSGFIGKWHLGGGKGFTPANRGFDWTSTNQKGPRNHFDPLMIRNGKREKREGYREDVFFDEAMTFIDETKDQPFFCYLATYSPHAPLAAPEKFLANYQGKVTEKQAAYFGMIENIDYNVGRILKFLKERDLEKNTIVVFMNDNGVTEGLDVYNAGMRGSKCTIWEGGSRAMSFWKWPGQWPAHKVDKLTAHLDVLPTLCDYAGAELPNELQQKLEGFSLRPLLESPTPKSWHDDRILYQHVARWPSGLASFHKHAMAGVRQGNHLLLRSHSCGNPDCQAYSSQCVTLNLVGKGLRKITYTGDNAQFHWGVSKPEQWSLFDSKKDPACQNDLSAEMPDLVKELSTAYDNWWDRTYPQMIAAGGDQGVPLKRGGRAKK